MNRKTVRAWIAAAAASAISLSLFTVALPALRSNAEEPAKPTRSVVIDDFSLPLENYQVKDSDKKYVALNKMTLEDGALVIKTPGSGDAARMMYTAKGLNAFTTTGYEYLEFDIWTDTADLFVKSNDGRIHLGVGNVDRTHDIQNLGGTGKANSVGALVPNQVNTIKIPITGNKFGTRTDANALSKNPEKKPAYDFTFDTYTLMLAYNGASNLGGTADAPFTVKISEVRLTRYSATPDPAPASKTQVVDDFSVTEGYVLDKTHSAKTTLEVKDGVLTMVGNGQKGGGFLYNSPNLKSFTTTGYDYIEFDIWTDTEDLYAKSNDARINLGVGTVERTHDNFNMGKGKAYCPGKLKANEVNTVRVPLSGFGLRANATVNPDNKPATDFTFDRYTLMIVYDGGNKLPSGTYTVKVSEVRLAKYDTVNDTAVKNVESLIDAIGEVTSHDADAAVEAAREAYDALNPSEQKAVSNLAKLTDAEKLLNTMPYKTKIVDAYDGTNTYAKQAAKWEWPVRGHNEADYTNGSWIIETKARNNAQSFLFDVTMPEAIDLTDYDYLEFDIKSNFANVLKLAGNSSRIQLYDSHYQEIVSAGGSDKNSEIYEVQSQKMPTLEKDTWVHVKLALNDFVYRTDSRASDFKTYRFFLQFSGATGYLKDDPANNEKDFAGTGISSVQVELKNMVVTSFQKPTSEEWDQMKADEVIEKINAIGTVTVDSGSKITAARNAYNALTSAQKEKVTNYETLKNAEKAYADLGAEVTVKKIDALGTIEWTDACRNAVKDARASYDALDTASKASVTNYDKLLSAEAKLSLLEAENNQPKKSVTLDDFKGNYQTAARDNQVFTHTYENGVMKVSMEANSATTGFLMGTVLPHTIAIQNFDYIEFDIKTNNSALYTTIRDARFIFCNSNEEWLINATDTKATIGDLAVNEWQHVKIPLSKVYNKANQKQFANTSVDIGEYRLMVVYNGANNLGGTKDNPVTIEYRNMNLTSYRDNAAYTVTQKEDSKPTKEVLITDFSDLADTTFPQAGEVYNRDEGYLEITNTADAHDTGFEFMTNLPKDVDASDCQYIEFDVWTNDIRIFSGLDQRVFLGSSTVLDGLESHQLAQRSFLPYLAQVKNNEWVRVRIPFADFVQSSNNPSTADNPQGLAMDKAHLSVFHMFFRFNGATALTGYTRENPAILRLRNVKAVGYAENHSFASSNESFTVTFMADGKQLAALPVHYGNSVEAPVAPAVSGKTFIGWDKSFDRVTGNMTVTALYRDNTEAVLKAAAEAALAKIGTVSKQNAAAQALLVADARQAVADLTTHVSGFKADTLANYSKLTAAEAALKSLTGYAVSIDGKRDSLYKEVIDLKDYTTLVGNKKLPDTAADGKMYLAWDDKNVYVYIEYPDTVGRIEARIDTDPSANKGDWRGKYATYSSDQSDELIIRAADGSIVFAGGKGDATMAAGLTADGKKTLEFAWPRAYGKNAKEEMFGLSAMATHPGDSAYYVSAYYDWDDYKTIHYYYTMSRTDLIKKAEKLIDAIGEVTEDNYMDKGDAIDAARTLIDNAVASYPDFSTDKVKNYQKLREAEHKYNYYFAGGEGKAPSLPPLEEIDLMISTESEDIVINMLAKVIQVNKKMTVKEFLSLLEYDEGLVPTVVNVDGRVLKGTSYVHDDLRLFLTKPGVGQSTFSLLYMGDEEITEPDELEPIQDNSDIDNPSKPDSSKSDDSPNTGVPSYAFAALAVLTAAAAAVTLSRRRAR